MRTGRRAGAAVLPEEFRETRDAVLRACRESAGLHERCAALYEQIALRAADDRLDRLVGLAAVERSRAEAARERARRLSSVPGPAAGPAAGP